MTGLILRPYQVQLSADLDACFAQGATGVCAVLPTGGGKTAVISTRLQLAIAQGEHVAVVAHRTELIEQTIKTLQRAGVTSIGAIAAKLPHLRADGARVQVCSLQTLLARGTTLALDRIVLDECHHFADDSHWGAFAAAYGHVKREGYTATPQRGDGKGLRGAFDAMAVGPSFADLVSMGFLVRPHVFAPPIHLGSRIAQGCVPFWLERGCAGKRTIWFCRSKTHGAALEQEYEAAGYPARLIDEGTSRAATQRAFADFLATPTRLPVLTNIFRLTEGTDLPATEVIGLARSCDEDITYVQAVGRGARPAPGKDHYVVLDMVGATRKHGSPMIPRRYALDGRGSEAVRAPEAWQCEFCGGIPPEHAPGEACPYCGALPAKDERPRKATPEITGDQMFAVGDDEGPGARRETTDPAQAAQAAADKAEAKRTRLMRNQVGPAGVVNFAREGGDWLALWHARQERKHQRP